MTCIHSLISGLYLMLQSILWSLFWHSCGSRLCCVLLSLLMIFTLTHPSAGVLCIVHSRDVSFGASCWRLLLSLRRTGAPLLLLLCWSDVKNTQNKICSTYDCFSNVHATHLPACYISAFDKEPWLELFLVSSVACKMKEWNVKLPTEDFLKALNCGMKSHQRTECCTLAFLLVILLCMDDALCGMCCSPRRSSETFQKLWENAVWKCGQELQLFSCLVFGQFAGEMKNGRNDVQIYGGYPDGVPMPARPINQLRPQKASDVLGCSEQFTKTYKMVVQSLFWWRLSALLWWRAPGQNQWMLNRNVVTAGHGIWSQPTTPGNIRLQSCFFSFSHLGSRAEDITWVGVFAQLSNLPKPQRFLDEPDANKR